MPGTFGAVMSKTPLRQYLDSIGQTAEAFATEHGLSAWSVRHWSRGDKHPSLQNQMELRDATAGMVTPESWLSYSLAKGGSESAAA